MHSERVCMHAVFPEKQREKNGKMNADMFGNAWKNDEQGRSEKDLDIIFNGAVDSIVVCAQLHEQENCLKNGFAQRVEKR